MPTDQALYAKRNESWWRRGMICQYEDKSTDSTLNTTLMDEIDQDIFFTRLPGHTWHLPALGWSRDPRSTSRQSGRWEGNRRGSCSASGSACHEIGSQFHLFVYNLDNFRQLLFTLCTFIIIKRNSLSVQPRPENDLHKYESASKETTRIFLYAKSERGKCKLKYKGCQSGYIMFADLILRQILKKTLAISLLSMKRYSK